MPFFFLGGGGIILVKMNSSGYVCIYFFFRDKYHAGDCILERFFPPASNLKHLLVNLEM